MATKSPKKSLLDYFKPVAEKKKKAKKLEIEESTEEADSNEIEEVEEVAEVGETTPTTPSGRRPTRACANRARVAWNEDESSSDEEYEVNPKSSRKRTRGSNNNNESQSSGPKKGSGRGKGRPRKEKDNDNSKKKVKLDPEAQAFLRSGVPDVIEKAKARAKTMQDKKKDEEDDDFQIILEKKNGLVEKRKAFDEATLAFLQSGVPDSVLKTREVVERRKEQDDALLNMGFFPKQSHTVPECHETETNAIEQIHIPFGTRAKSAELAEGTEESPDQMFLFSIHCDVNINNGHGNGETISKPSLNCLSSKEDSFYHPVVVCCDTKNESSVLSSSQESRSLRKSKANHGIKKDKEEDTRPWVEIIKPTCAKDLIVDATGAETLTNWLKQWRRDIKDDGGTSRKLEKKRKRGNSSDSDFITSDEEESELKKKSVLLTGPSGCGKTAAVYVLAKQLGFHVVEVNFSSRRSGKETLQRVEEAVLSHRLESSHNCLLLFEDIDLYHPDEDEGFFSAVAQLITTAIRPIVMTSSLLGTSFIDSKLEKKDPLRISFTYPKPKQIIEKIFKPTLALLTDHFQCRNENSLNQKLDSVVRHCGCDIRRSINQLQLLLTPSLKSSSVYSKPTARLSLNEIHLHSNPFSIHSTDLNIQRQVPLRATPSSLEQNSAESGLITDEEDEESQNVKLSLKAKKKRTIRQLEALHEGLEMFADLDWISGFPIDSSSLKVNSVGDEEEAKWYRNYVSRVRLPYQTKMAIHYLHNYGPSVTKGDLMSPNWLKELVLESDADVEKWQGIVDLNDEISQYGAGGPADLEWECNGAIRTIIKNNKLSHTVGTSQKRHGRIATYFNRVDRNLIDKISNTFNFQQELNEFRVAS